MTGGELAVACLLDAAVGDPRWFPHPVRWMGFLVNWCDRRVHQLLLSPAKQRMAGVLLAVGFPAGAYVVGAFLIWSGNSIDSLWGARPLCCWLGPRSRLGILWTMSYPYNELSNPSP